MKKSVVIIGGTKGLGLEITRNFLESGYRVACGSRIIDNVDLSKSNDLKLISVDARSRKSIRNFFELASDWSGELNNLIYCAGVSIWKPIQEIDEDFLKNMTETNVYGAFWSMQCAAEKMKTGNIVAISSLAGKRGSANNSAYCSTKFALNGLTQSLAKELGPRGIRVNAVCPVYIETDMILKQLTDPNSPAAGSNVKDYLESFAKTQAALKRLPLAKEVAKACLYLVSNEASAITGQCINVDCGVLPQ